MLKKILIIVFSLFAVTSHAKTPFTVGFIFIGHINDGGFTQAQNVARVELEKKLNIKTIYKENVPEGSQVQNVIAQMIDQGAKVIVGGSFGYMDYMVKMSRRYPDIKFLHASGYKRTKNLGTFFGRGYQGRFLAGIVAGLKAKSLNKPNLGMVAAFPIPEVVRNINAFALGAKEVYPQAKVEVIWTHTWNDSTKEKSAAEALLNKNIKVIAMYQDTPTTLIAAQEHHAFSIGTDTNMEHFAPKSVLTSVEWHWAPYLIKEVQKIINNEWEVKDYFGGLKEGIVKVSPVSKNATKGAQKIVDKYKQKIINGSFNIFGHRTIKDQTGNIRVTKSTKLSDKQLLSQQWFVSNVIGKVK